MLMHRASGKSRHRGFSMIEIAITLVIFALLIALGAVHFTLVAPTNPAVLDDTCATSAAGTSWVVSLDDPAGKCASDPSSSVVPRIVAKKAGSEGSAVAAVAGTDASDNASSSVTFNGFGRTNGATALTQINVTSTGSGTRALRVQISNGGAVRLCDPVITDTTDPRKC